MSEVWASFDDTWDAITELRLKLSELESRITTQERERQAGVVAEAIAAFERTQADFKDQDSGATTRQARREVGHE
jgi:hypothetical protein